MDEKLVAAVDLLCSLQVLSERTCSCFREANTVRLYNLRRKYSVKLLAFLNMSRYSTDSTDEFILSSKQRSRGPVMAAKNASEGAKQEDGKYKQTVDLPKTTFGMRANSTVREPEIQKLWDDNQRSFILHDGPPYANGDLHMGHALNKILKDIINRYKLLQNCKVHYAPGWDCHGLPIELKGKLCLVNSKVSEVLQSLDKDTRKELTLLILRAKAAEFAKETVKSQMASFKCYGAWGDWNNPYLTVNPEYEAAQPQLGFVWKLYDSGLLNCLANGLSRLHIQRQKASPLESSCTALAEAELEYPDGHVSKSNDVIFKVVSAPSNSGGFLEEFFQIYAWPYGLQLPGLFLPMLMMCSYAFRSSAVAVNAKHQYAVVVVGPPLDSGPVSTREGKHRLGNALKEQKNLFLIVASDLVAALEAKWRMKLSVRKTFLGSDLENCRYKAFRILLHASDCFGPQNMHNQNWEWDSNLQHIGEGEIGYVHPIGKGECPVVIRGDYITTESGTGLVHAAPGNGKEDDITGLKYGLSIFSPVDEAGNFTEEAGQFSGLNVLGEGNTAVVNHLDECLALIMEEPYRHNYPYDWRTKKPTIFRATEQWFASVEGFRQAAMEAIALVIWIPAQAENRISAMTSSSSDWCISRQRTWGVPIPVFYHVHTREPLMNEETINHIKTTIAEKGSDAWWHMTTEELLPDKYRDKASDYEKETDTMDVWFDSGSSWAAVLEKRIGLRRAPYLGVITHGFVLDEKGLKMSKSLGNVVDPRSIIEGGKNQKESPAYGADVLRLWVSSVDYTGDVLIGPQVLRQRSDIYRKLRGTLRYLFANLHDWKICLTSLTPLWHPPPRGLLQADYTVPYNELPRIDQHALFQLESVVNNIKESYESYQFFKIFEILLNFVLPFRSKNLEVIKRGINRLNGLASLTNKKRRRISYFVTAPASEDAIVSSLRAEKAFRGKQCSGETGSYGYAIIQRFAIVDLSNFYFDVAKDRLYVGGTTSFTRRSCQTVLAAHLLSLARVIAPILPHLAEDVWQNLPFQYTLEDGSIAEFLRTEVNKVLEVARTQKLIGSSLEAKVWLHVSDADLASRMHEMCAADNEADALHRIFITSQVEIIPSLENEEIQVIEYKGEYLIQEENKVWIAVSHADGTKCERCWNYSLQVGSFSKHPTLCGRCFNVVSVQILPAMAAVS
ncbi:Methionyl/Valyl/Leucyl/Isoleucyl-tRNA synthetase, anticodon-binding [Dillenia turbinata]|uniref:isoleucine--tRNA ligase n=1 Tax=Dillenia turbinata TaxID=194707 RepID=A0AAN8Z9X9_9MAGN